MVISDMQADTEADTKADSEPETHTDTESGSEAKEHASSEPASQAPSPESSQAVSKEAPEDRVSMAILGVLDVITPRLEELSATIARMAERLDKLEQSQATATSLSSRRERGRGIWLYLRESVIAELQRIAQERGVSVSQVANELLTRALGLR